MTLLDILNKAHLTALVAFVAALVAKVILDLHGGIDTHDLSNILYGTVAAMIGVPVATHALNTAHESGVKTGVLLAQEPKIGSHH